MIRNNLPPQPTPFLGRERELAEIDALLLDPASRLVTLLGPGGIGKTRLALEAAARQSKKGDSPFGDGIYFVPLQSLNEVDYIAPAIADAMKYSFSSGEDPRDQLLSYLRDKAALLVMDNFEHLLPGADLVATILEGCPQVKILLTSREVLGLQEEWIRPVEGLEFPGQDLPQRLEDYSAVQLFTERARRVQPQFSPEQEQACVLRICRLVQGMPLAIELAAAWLKSLPCAEVAAEIQHSLDFLATRLRNVPERHRSVRAVFDQSWRHLSEEEQAVFRRLAVFQGGFTRQAAEAVAQASPTLLQALVDQSLLSLNPGGRYQLHELLRQFAAEQLDGRPEEHHKTRQLHSRHFAGFLAGLEPRLKGSDQLSALSQMDQEIDNIRAAWRWMSMESDTACLDRAMSSLALYYQIRSRFQEGKESFERAAQGSGGSPVYGYLLQAATWFHASITGWGPQWPRYKEALSWMREPEISRRMAFPLMSLCFVEVSPEEEEQVLRFFRDNLASARENEDTWACAWFKYSLGVMGSRQGLTPEARLLLEESISAFERCGDRWGSTAALHHLGSMIAEQGNYLEARAIFHRSLQLCKEIGDQGGVEFSLHFLGEIARGMQEYEGSMNYLLDAIQIGKGLNSFMYFWHLYEMSSSLEAAGRLEWAVEVFSYFCEHYPDKSDWEEYSQFCSQGFDRLRAGLPEKAFDAARRRGEREDLDSLLKRLVQEVSILGDGSAEAEAVPLPEGQKLIEPLSPREQEVLALVGAGLSNREIADRLVITVGAVKKHLNNIFGKLQASSRTQAVARAREAGLLR